MTADTWIIIGTGVVIIAANVGLIAWLRGDLVEMSKRVDSLSERMARMEGKMDLLLQGLQLRIGPKRPA